jgi:hypothetical protein
METAAEQPVVFGSQQYIDRLTLMYHREVATRLAREPKRIIGIARSNLQRWLQAYEPGSSDGRCLEEWQEILRTRTPAEVIAIITEDSNEGQRLRSSTPFTGILTLEERKELRRICAETAII